MGFERGEVVKISFAYHVLSCNFGDEVNSAPEISPKLWSVRNSNTFCQSPCFIFARAGDEALVIGFPWVSNAKLI